MSIKATEQCVRCGGTGTVPADWDGATWASTVCRCDDGRVVPRCECGAAAVVSVLGEPMCAGCVVGRDEFADEPTVVDVLARAPMAVLGEAAPLAALMEARG